MERLFCSVPEEVAGWLKQLAEDQRTTVSEILRRIIVGIHDEAQSSMEHLVKHAPWDDLAVMIGGTVGDIVGYFQGKEPNQYLEPYYLWLSTGIPDALKKIGKDELFKEEEEEEEEGWD